MIDRQSIKRGTHILVGSGSTAYKAKYVGYLHVFGSDSAVIRKEGDDDELHSVGFYEMTIDPAHHHDPSMDGQDYGLLCACGHPYGRHFDGYEKDKIFPDKPYHAGCKYCGCSCWYAPTPENQLNRLHEHRVYKLRMNRLLQVSRYVAGKPRMGHGRTASQKESLTLAKNEVLYDVSVIHGDSKALFVRGTLSGDEVEISDLPIDSFEVLKRQWQHGYEPRKDDLEMEKYQPEMLRLVMPVPLDIII